MSLAAYRGRVLGSQSDIHVAVRDNFDTIVDVPGSQMTFRELMDVDARQVEEGVGEALVLLGGKGPLFRKSPFGDSVMMDPELNVAQPTVVGTSLETLFVAERVRETSVEYVAETYRISPKRVRRAVEFEAAA